MLLSILKQMSLGRIGSDLSAFGRFPPPSTRNQPEFHTFGIVGANAIIFIKQRARVVELHLKVRHIQTKCFGQSVKEVIATGLVEHILKDALERPCGSWNVQHQFLVPIGISKDCAIILVAHPSKLNRSSS